MDSPKRECQNESTTSNIRSTYIWKGLHPNSGETTSNSVDDIDEVEPAEQTLSPLPIPFSCTSRSDVYNNIASISNHNDVISLNFIITFIPSSEPNKPQISNQISSIKTYLLQCKCLLL